MATSVSGVGSISSAGLGSGLDVASILNQLMAVEKRPLTLLQDQATSLNTRLSSVGKMQGYFSALRDKANALTGTGLWGSTLATSADTAAVKVSTSTGATTGSYAVNVNRLAVSQTVTGSALASSASTLNAGTLTIELGSYGSGSPAAGFTAKSGSSPVAGAPSSTVSAALTRKAFSAPVSFERRLSRVPLASVTSVAVTPAPAALILSRMLAKLVSPAPMVMTTGLLPLLAVKPTAGSPLP